MPECIDMVYPSGIIVLVTREIRTIDIIRQSDEESVGRRYRDAAKSLRNLRRARVKEYGQPRELHSHGTGERETRPRTKALSLISCDRAAVAADARAPERVSFPRRVNRGNARKAPQAAREGRKQLRERALIAPTVSRVSAERARARTHGRIVIAEQTGARQTCGSN